MTCPRVPASALPTPMPRYVLSTGAKVTHLKCNQILSLGLKTLHWLPISLTVTANVVIIAYRALTSPLHPYGLISHHLPPHSLFQPRWLPGFSFCLRTFACTVPSASKFFPQIAWFAPELLQVSAQKFPQNEAFLNEPI